MATIKESKRLVKRAILANLAVNKKNLAITPLLSGKHGIGKSQIIKSIADDLGGICITVEGGTLKEGEITGLPYQYKDEEGNLKFRFLPYYAVERIQSAEKRIYEEQKCRKGGNLLSVLDGDENRYASENLNVSEKISLIRSRKVVPVILFIDEINRTENTVYKELMNILLTRSVNGYRFPWWVFFVGAMNPSTQNSTYATNEMDPAQLDRFIKIKVTEEAAEWIEFAELNKIAPEIIQFIKENPKCLSVHSKELEDEEKPMPSPRGWDMIDSLMKSEPYVREFFTMEENEESVIQSDLKALTAAKLGSSVSTMFFSNLVSKVLVVTPEELFADDEILTAAAPKIRGFSTAKKVQMSELLLNYLKENIEFDMLDRKGFEKQSKQIAAYVRLLDPSSRLLFAQNIAAASTAEGTNLIELLYDVFEKELLEMLDLSDQTGRLIKRK